MIATSLVGRLVKGHHWVRNPDYVPPDNAPLLVSHSEKQRKELTEHQMTYQLKVEVTERIVAVYRGEDGLEIWVLVDGVPTSISGCRVMPAGWEPEIQR